MNPPNSGAVRHENWIGFLRKMVRTDVFFSSMMTPKKTLNEVILDGHVLDKNLLWFLQIRLHLAVTALSRSRLSQINRECEKRG
jgi:hypothetical protein